MKQTIIRLFSLLLLGMVVTGAQATAYYKNYRIKLDGNPTGKGKVYVSWTINNNGTNTTDQNAESVDAKATVSSSNGYHCKLYAVPIDGYELLGFSTVLHEDISDYTEDEFIKKEDDQNVRMKSGDQVTLGENGTEKDDNDGEGDDGYETAQAKWKNPDYNGAPTMQFYAIFKERLINVEVDYFQPGFIAGQNSTCGTWTRELTTDGKVLLTAIPKPGFIIKEWRDANGTVSTENPITVENENVTYYPNFDLAPFEMPNSTLATFSHVYFVNYESAKPDGLKAYKVTAIGANGLTLEQVKQVNANTGVIIEAEPNETYTMTYNGVIFPKDQEGNLLKSSASGPVQANGKIYVLAYKSQGLGFYKLADGAEVPQGKAYLEIDDANNARDFFGFDDGTTTSISSVAEVEQPTPIYNMAGQRVSGSFSGLVIQNGRKYIRK